MPLFVEMNTFIFVSLEGTAYPAAHDKSLRFFPQFLKMNTFTFYDTSILSASQVVMSGTPRYTRLNPIIWSWPVAEQLVLSQEEAVELLALLITSARIQIDEPA